ncbi:Wzz/FepE/Etk N-terminal domain-containing protein [Paenibacillus silviterrae]|uniref:Wzz/FepE/Etk N-terminal domain-containing protein n=1 Tax=Paenibacillus silviterrae TaxID=3242194 RepID=UPI002543A4B9|nr:Wzz/FepE/Etk N-terminal domain-containing protein [Paenibacillus chinjuensis]
MPQEEIKLSELVVALWKGKNLIIAILITSLLISSIYSFFIVSPVYEANTLVTVNQIKTTENSQLKDLNALVAQMESERTIQKMKNQLKYTSAVRSLKKAVKVELTRENLVTIKAQNNKPEIAVEIANYIAHELAATIDISNRLDFILENKKLITTIENDLAALNKEYEQAKNELVSTPEKVTVKRSLAEDPFLHSIVNEEMKQSSKNTGAISFDSEQVNPVYIDMKNKINEQMLKISKLSAEKENYELRIKENQDNINKLQDTEHSKNSTQQQYITTDQVVVITSAIEPTEPTGPNKTLIYIISIFLGGLLSIFIVIVRFLWVRAGISLKSASNGTSLNV